MFTWSSNLVLIDAGDNSTAFLWYRSIVVVFSFICDYDGSCVLYCCLNVFADGTTSRSASVIIPECFEHNISNHGTEEMGNVFSSSNLGLGFPFTIFCPYLRHLYPSQEIPTSPAAWTTSLCFFPGLETKSELCVLSFFNLKHKIIRVCCFDLSKWRG